MLLQGFILNTFRPLTLSIVFQNLIWASQRGEKILCLCQTCILKLWCLLFFFFCFVLFSSFYTPSFPQFLPPNSQPHFSTVTWGLNCYLRRLASVVICLLGHFYLLIDCYFSYPCWKFSISCLGFSVLALLCQARCSRDTKFKDDLSWTRTDRLNFVSSLSC